MSNQKLFDLEPVSRSTVKKHDSTKKNANTKRVEEMIANYTTGMNERGLNSVWRNFGEWIENGRSNKTIQIDKK